MAYRFPVPLGPAHGCDAFECRSAEQTRWLQRYARASVAMGSTHVFVVTSTDDDDVVAYYAWRMGEITFDQAPSRWKRGSGKYPQPVAVLARLAVHREHEGRGIAAGMLRDVLLRFLVVAEEIGVRGMLIHCEDLAAKQFYEHIIPEFTALDDPASPTSTLVLLAKDLRKSLAKSLRG